MKIKYLDKKKNDNKKVNCFQIVAKYIIVVNVIIRNIGYKKLSTLVRFEIFID